MFALTNSRKELLKEKRFFLVSSFILRFPPLCSFAASSLNLPALRELTINQLQLRQLRRCQTSSLCSGLLILTVAHIINLVAVKRSPPSPIFLTVFC